MKKRHQYTNNEREEALKQIRENPKYKEALEVQKDIAVRASRAAAELDEFYMDLYFRRKGLLAVNGEGLAKEKPSKQRPSLTLVG